MTVNPRHTRIIADRADRKREIFSLPMPVKKHYFNAIQAGFLCHSSARVMPFKRP
jgi:hypothetical protein